MPLHYDPRLTFEDVDPIDIESLKVYYDEKLKRTLVVLEVPDKSTLEKIKTAIPALFLMYGSDIAKKLAPYVPGVIGKILSVGLGKGIDMLAKYWNFKQRKIFK